MSRFTRISFASSARREIKRLSEDDRRELLDLLDLLEEEPLPHEALLMRGTEDTYRIRFGSNQMRLVYRYFSKAGLIKVMRIRPRGTAYKGMPNP